MIRVVILVHTIHPPSVRKCVKGVFRILNLVPGITSNASGLRIVGREDGRDGKIHVHVSKILVQQFHPIVVSLYACLNGRIVPLVRFHCAMGHEIHLHIFKANPMEQFGCFLHHGLYCRMGGIQSIGSVQFLRLSVGIEVHILVFASRYFLYLALRVLSPICKRCPIHTGHLAVGLATVYKILQLLFRKDIPTGIQADIDQIVRIGKMIGLQIACIIVRNLQCLGIAKLELECAPAVPSERNGLVPRLGRSHRCIGGGVFFHAQTPVVKTTQQNFGRLDGNSPQCTVGLAVTGGLVGHSSVTLQRTDIVCIATSHDNSRLPVVMLHRTHHQRMAVVIVVHRRHLITGQFVKRKRAGTVSYPAIIIKRNEKGAVVLAIGQHLGHLVHINRCHVIGSHLFIGRQGEICQNIILIGIHIKRLHQRRQHFIRIGNLIPESLSERIGNLFDRHSTILIIQCGYGTVRQLVCSIQVIEHTQRIFPDVYASRPFIKAQFPTAVCQCRFFSTSGQRQHSATQPGNDFCVHLHHIYYYGK